MNSIAGMAHALFGCQPLLVRPGGETAPPSSTASPPPIRTPLEHTLPQAALPITQKHPSAKHHHRTSTTNASRLVLNQRDAMQVGLAGLHHLFSAAVARQVLRPTGPITLIVTMLCKVRQN